MPGSVCCRRLSAPTLSQGSFSLAFRRSLRPRSHRKSRLARSTALHPARHGPRQRTRRRRTARWRAGRRLHRHGRLPSRDGSRYARLQGNPLLLLDSIDPTLFALSNPLHLALAMGDFNALESRNKPVDRLYLIVRVADGLAEMERVIHQALGNSRVFTR
jgi:hypothetical protein